MTAPRSRAAQKGRTRRAILDAALHLTAEAPLAALSLRQVAREAGIQAPSFYRHFDSTDAVALALVDEAFTALRGDLRSVRLAGTSPEEFLSSAVDALVVSVMQRRSHLALIARERFAGTPAVRDAVRLQLTLFESEVAIDLARMVPRGWSSEDVRLMAKLVVVAMTETVADVLSGQLQTDEQVRHQAQRMLRLLVAGFLRTPPDDGEA